MSEGMQKYIKTIIIAVQMLFFVVGAGFAFILLPELYRLYSVAQWKDLQQDVIVGAFALAACIAGIAGAKLVKHRLLKRS